MVGGMYETPEKNKVNVDHLGAFDRDALHAGSWTFEYGFTGLF